MLQVNPRKGIFGPKLAIGDKTSIADKSGLPLLVAGAQPLIGEGWGPESPLRSTRGVSACARARPGLRCPLLGENIPRGKVIKVIVELRASKRTKNTDSSLKTTKEQRFLHRQLLVTAAGGVLRAGTNPAKSGLAGTRCSSSRRRHVFCCYSINNAA